MKLRTTLTALLVFALALPVVATAANRFSDVEGHQYEEAIQAVVATSLFQGYQDNTFQPDRKLSADEWRVIAGRLSSRGWSRAEVAVFLQAGLEALEQPSSSSQPANEEPISTTSRPVVIETTTSTTTGSVSTSFYSEGEYPAVAVLSRPEVLLVVSPEGWDGLDWEYRLLTSNPDCPPAESWNSFGQPEYFTYSNIPDCIFGRINVGETFWFEIRWPDGNITSTPHCQPWAGECVGFPGWRDHLPSWLPS